MTLPNPKQNHLLDALLISEFERLSPNLKHIELPLGACIPLSNTINRRVVLNSRPIGKPTLENFRIVEGAVLIPGTGQILLHTLYLSLDPYMRGRMSDAASLAIDDVIVGSTISLVETSLNPDFKQGDVVLSSNGWQEYALSDGKDIIKLCKNSEDKYIHSSLNLGVLGMPGFTALWVC